MQYHYDYQAQYERELAEWDRHRSGIVNPLTICTIVGGIIGYAIQKFEFAGDFLSVLFELFCGTAMLFLGIAVFEISQQMHGHTYRRIAKPLEILSFELALEEWRLAKGATEADAKSYFAGKINRVYAENATFNASINAMRSERLFRANRMLIVAAAFSFFLLPLVAFQSMSSTAKPVKVEIVGNPSELTSSMESSK